MWDWGEPPTFARSGQGNATFFFVRAGKVVAGHEYYDVPASNMPWNVREMHLRHPDGHVFRVSRRNEDEQ